MGQRHQLFVIAKIGNRYRGLAAVHHQWLYGATALKRCLGILNIFSAPVNRLPLQQELTIASTCDDELWDRSTSCHEIHVPFPFITTCLVLGVSFDIRERYNAIVSPEPFNMYFDEGDNNDGITVIDITDLDRVRYCFVLWDGCDVFSQDEDANILQLTPLSGSLYLGAYYNSNEQEERVDLQELVRRFDSWDLISSSALRDAWPEGDWQDNPGNDKDSGDNPASQPASSLRASTMTQLIETTLQQTEVDLSWMPEAELLSDFLPSVTAKLRSDPTLLVTSPAAKLLLSKTIEHERDVDLSLFQNLTTEELSDLTCKLSKKSVSLSFSGPNVTTDLMRTIVSANPSLQRMYVLGASNLPLQPTLELLHESKLHAIYHSAMFRPALEEVHHEETRCPSSQMTTRFPVIQILWVCRELRESDHVLRLDDGGIPWASILRKSTRSYNPFEPCIAAFPLRDAVLSSARVVTGLAKILSYLITSDTLSGANKKSTVAASVAKSFAMSSLVNLDPPKQVEIGPLPAELYRAAKEMYHSSGAPPPRLQNLKQGEWIVVIAHEVRDAYEEHPAAGKLRYAFITTPTLGATAFTASATRPEDELCDGQERQCSGKSVADTDTDQGWSIPKAVTVADMKSFLEQVATEGQSPSGAQELYNYWLEHTKEFAPDGFGMCGKQEIDSIIQAMTTYEEEREKLIQRFR